jgi:hypothetical protein
MQSARQEVEVVAGVTRNALPRVVLMVRSESGDAVATWEVVAAPLSGPPRRVHHSLSRTEPVRTAFLQARAHAEQESIRYLCILDPDGLFPREQWAV